MLKYTVRPSKETVYRDFPIRNFYVSPELSYISGITDYNTGLVDGEEIAIRSPYLIGEESNTINVKNVRIQGKVGVKLVLPVSSITKTVRIDLLTEGGKCYYYEKNRKVYIDCSQYSGDYFFKKIEEKYVNYRGDISYYFYGENRTGGYLIDHKFYEANENENSVTIETYVFIEDGKLAIGDYVYYADFVIDGQKPEIKLNKYKEPISGGSLLGLLNGYYCYAMSDSDGGVLIKNYLPSEWERVSKFYIQKHENPRLEPDEIMYGGYRHYITFKEENYYLQDVFIDNDYMGYGVEINGFFYPEIPSYVDGDVYDGNKDLNNLGSVIYIAETDETLEVQDSLVSLKDGGKFILFIDSSENTDIETGNFIVAESNGPINVYKIVESEGDGDSNRFFITFNGMRYDVKANLCDTITINGFNYPLTYLNDAKTSASTVINGETLYFDVSLPTGKLSNKIYYKSGQSTVDSIKVKYGINENSYNIIQNSGVTIDEKNYPVIVESIETEDGSINSYHVEFQSIVKETFEVYGVNGSSTYLCYPVVSEGLLDEYGIDYLQREICSLVVENWKQFNFLLRKDTFGKNQFTPDNGLLESMKAQKPYTTSDAFLLESKIEIFRVQNYLSFKFPLVNKEADNLRREEIIKSDFVNDIRNKAINKVVDMEKDIYFPVYKKIVDEEGTYNFFPIRRLRFNLHFRTRDLDSWKIIEDDREFLNTETPNYKISNWFVTDYKYYKNELAGGDEAKKIQESSDLLGFLGFSTNDVKNQASKLEKTFLRLSYYTTNDPKTQILLATYTVYFDMTAAYKKFLDAHRNSDLIYVNAKMFEDSDYEILSEYCKAVADGTDNLQISGKSISTFTEVLDDRFLNDGFRLSSRFMIDDKYTTDTSAEGYYIYIFREYAKKMRESTIYLKVELNHAGYGKTLQFMLPRKFGVGDEIGTPLYLHNSEDVEILKKGFKMQDIYKQIYIPIRIVYDDKTNKYVYYLPPEIMDKNVEVFQNEEEIMEFNLFETKFANESIVGYYEDNKY